ncbi:MAG: fused MFS/spermidine synthase [Chloroflexota bacterium]|nr:fused MFS/spermidine synthase [Chloroflexota bacterium]MDQ5865516.1 fused MFS/spermidine synthase [Chloroflexota bacterium]
MATTTENPATPLVNANAATAVAARSRVAGLVLMFVVFIGGASVMTVEMSASRLLAPYFGTSLFIWANLIGLVMVYLALGYWLGGKLADRYPRASLLYTITAVAGLAVAFIPMLSRPILSWSLTGFSQVSVGIFYSSLVGVILLFSVPLLLLGFVSPFAIRLRSVSAASAGGTAGQVSALSTLGSILGTLFPTFFLIPYIGTAATLYLASVVLLVFSIIGLLSTSNTRQAMLSAVMLLVVLGLAAFAPRGLVKPPERGELIYEKESAYNYIQVVREGKRLGLMLNEGRAIHSIYNPDELLTGGPWDYWAIAPYFSQGFQPDDYKSMAMIGSAAGTASHIITEAYGPIPMDGVEIDPEIVEVGRRYFALDTLPNVTTHVEDGRTYLQTGGRGKQWTVIGIDAYRQPYIPFHLTTVEFFQEVKDHLTPDGAVMINAGRTLHDTRLVDALANTMLQVYPNVYVIDVPTMANSMIIGTASPSRFENFAENASRVDQPVLKQIFDVSQQKGNMREVEPDAARLVFTDDKAPIEEVINQIILGYVEEAGR